MNHIRRFIITGIAMVSGMLAMAISAPDNLRWDLESRTFSWELAEDAPYCTYTFDGVTRGFIRYQCEQFEVDNQWLSPGVHTFCIYALDANLNSSEWRCLEIFIHDLSDTIVTEGPAAPVNLQAWQSGANEITLTWQPGDENTHFCVFLDERAVNYDVQANMYVFRGVEAGTHTVGVSTWGANGYVSEMVSMTVECHGAVTYTVELARAHWSFENDPEWIRGSIALTNTELAEYAYSDSSAMVLESEAGGTAYVILPMISDVADYDSLELSFVARGGYWSRGAEVWGKTSHDHKLTVGAMRGLPYTGFRTDSVSILLETTLPYANPFNMEDYDADSTHYWRQYSIPLTGSTLPFIVFYTGSDRADYVIIDDIRVGRLSNPETPSDEDDTPEEPSGLEETTTKAPRKVIRDGNIVIIRNGEEYDITGRRILSHR